MRDKFIFIFVMLIFGSIGIFVKQIELSSGTIAFFRGVIGSLFLIVASFTMNRSVTFKVGKWNRFLLFISGAALGLNWIFLFESYRYTTITNATLSYYFAPVFVMILAPFLLKEKMVWQNWVGLMAAIVGLLFVLNPGNESPIGEFHHPLGIFYGLLAATLYASVIIINKFLRGLSAFETTVNQLLIATMILFPYVFFTEGFHVTGLDIRSIFFLIIIGIVHTGIAYVLYFPTVKKLRSQTVALFSYIDPISAVIMSSLILGEWLSFNQFIGGIFILGSTFFNDVPKKDRL
ncbi:DMT family transporter [Fervidibacillus halotolerans]|uniref:DMT family transporter n=1 Tax=Fervidibacillus halotolerans TaxID=2980027 RepID=A0A9E8LXT8_9BACI|nr:DMT family transporter [Fervidibacillus halotolerans]WAA11728.1 DMT family transporter [Fervidibacillus halotolerans]